MREVEVKLRAGMARQGISGAAARPSSTPSPPSRSTAFPESHAASFALLAYASAYLKAHHPAAFYAALLNNQPMGFYDPATIVGDARRHGQGIRPADVNFSGWLCAIEPDGWCGSGCATCAGCGRRRACASSRSAAAGPSPRWRTW